MNLKINNQLIKSNFVKVILAMTPFTPHLSHECLENQGYTDQLINELPENILNLRIRMPITGKPDKRNFITKITNYEKICSIPNSMTVLDELLPIILHMMKNTETGTYNMTNPGVIEHNEILELYKKFVDKNFIWKNFSIKEQDKILKSERSNNRLNTTKLEEYCNINELRLTDINLCVTSLLKLKNIDF